MISSFIEQNLVSIITVGASVVYFISKLDSANKTNREFFQNELKHIAELIKLNHANLQGDIQRLKEKNETEFKMIKEDISRLDQKAEQSNHVRERVCLLEAANKSAHHRIDRLEDKSEEE